MKWKPQSTDEVREENYSLSRLRGGDDLPLGRKAVGNFLRQIPGRPKLDNVFLLDGGDQAFALTSGSGHGRMLFRDGERWGLGHWSSRMEGQRKGKA